MLQKKIEAVVIMSKQLEIAFPNENKRQCPGSLEEDNVVPSPSFSDVLEAIQTTNTHISKVEENLTTSISKIESSVNQANGRLAALESHIKKQEDQILQLSAGHEKVSTQYEHLKSLIDALTERVKNEEMARDDLETQGRRYCLTVSGIQETEGENCIDIIYKLYKYLNINQDKSTIDICHRTFAKHLIVRFTSCTARDALYDKRSKLKGVTAEDLGFKGTGTDIFINESLSFARSKIMKEARIRMKAYNEDKSLADKVKLNTSNGVIKMKCKGKNFKIMEIDDIPI